MRGFVDRMMAREGHDGILSISFVHGFPYGDTPDTGAKVLVYGDRDRATAENVARELRREIWDMREQTRSSPSASGNRTVAPQGSGLLVLADMADNPGGGAPGDSTFILRAAIDRGVQGAALHCYDPQAVQTCFDAGIGARIDLRIGGKTAPTSGANPST